jgi:hypothetical protein
VLIKRLNKANLVELAVIPPKADKLRAIGFSASPAIKKAPPERVRHFWWRVVEDMWKHAFHVGYI